MLYGSWHYNQEIKERTNQSQLLQRIIFGNDSCRCRRLLILYLLQFTSASIGTGSSWVAGSSMTIPKWVSSFPNTLTTFDLSSSKYLSYLSQFGHWEIVWHSKPLSSHSSKLNTLSLRIRFFMNLLCLAKIISNKFTSDKSCFFVVNL